MLNKLFLDIKKTSDNSFKILLTTRQTDFLLKTTDKKITKIEDFFEINTHNKEVENKKTTENKKIAESKKLKTAKKIGKQGNLMASFLRVKKK